MELFDIIKTIFTNPLEYSSISSGEKRKYYFILNRRFAVNFPLQANALQHIKINQNVVIDFWQSFLRSKYTFVPHWVYVKGTKKIQESKEKESKLSQETIKEYCKYNKISQNTLKDSLYFFKDETIKELKEFDKILKQK